MTYPLPMAADASPDGVSYAVVLVRGDVGVLREIGFSGWLAAAGSGGVAAGFGGVAAGSGGVAAGGWSVAVAARTDRAVATGRRDIVAVGAWLASRLDTPTLAIRVVDDRQLTIASGNARYVSDPAYGKAFDPYGDPFPEPEGVEHAPAFAAACGRPDAADDLAELLAEELDPDSVFESERLLAILRLLGLPEWVIAVPSLPRDVPTGPRAGEFTRLRAGRTGPVARLLPVDRFRRPPR